MIFKYQKYSKPLRLGYTYREYQICLICLHFYYPVWENRKYISLMDIPCGFRLDTKKSHSKITYYESLQTYIA